MFYKHVDFHSFIHSLCRFYSLIDRLCLLEGDFAREKRGGDCGEEEDTLETQKSQERNKSPFVFLKGLGRMIQN